MTDELKLYKTRERAARAKALREDTLLNEAFDMTETDLMKLWGNTDSSQTETRENIHMLVKLLGRLRNHLFQVVEEGKVAEKQIEELVKNG